MRVTIEPHDFEHKEVIEIQSNQDEDSIWVSVGTPYKFEKGTEIAIQLSKKETQALIHVLQTAIQ